MPRAIRSAISWSKCLLVFIARSVAPREADSSVPHRTRRGFGARGWCSLQLLGSRPRSLCCATSLRAYKATGTVLVLFSIFQILLPEAAKPQNFPSHLLICWVIALSPWLVTFPGSRCNAASQRCPVPSIHLRLLLLLV